jgi:hypothetical protein
MVIIIKPSKASTILVEDRIVSVTGITPILSSNKWPGVATNNAEEDE